MHEATPVRLSAAIMTHPARIRAAQALRDRHPELRLRIILDPAPSGPPSAWRTAREAWRHVDDDATHHLVLQDDAVTADDFSSRVLELISARPLDPIALFVEWGSRTASAIRLAAAAGCSWAEVVDDYVPTVGLVLPAPLARGLEPFAAGRGRTDDPDDVVLLDYLRGHGLTAVAPVDGPVQHDAATSLVGNTIMGLRRSVHHAARSTAAVSRSLLRPVAVPYYDWWDQQAAMFVPDAGEADGWRRLRSGPAFEHLGVERAAADRGFDALPDAGPTREAVDDRVSRIIQRELWRTAFLLGVVVAEGRGPHDPFADKRFLSTLDTLAPGGLRRIVPEHLLGDVAGLLRPIVVGGAQGGFRHRSAMSVDAWVPAEGAQR